MTSITFLCGPLRSGTTVLGLMFRYHPDMHAPGEYDFLFDYLDDEPEKTSKTDFYSGLRKNRVYNRVKLSKNPLLNPVEQVRDFVDQLRDNNERILINLHRNFYRIPKVFPEAKYIHLLRDPRDVARSAIGMGWAGNVYHGVDIWMESERDWDRLMATNPAIEYTSVRFESLIMNTREELTRLCDFLGVEYTDEMLSYHKHTTYDLPNPSLVEQWKKRQTYRERELVEWRVGDMLEKKGYRPGTDGPKPPGNFEKCCLWVENVWRKNAFRLRRYGPEIYFQDKVGRWLRLRKLEERALSRMHGIDERLVK